MDTEDKRIIREVLETTRENQEMLKKMRKAQLFGNVTRVLYWVIILGASFGAYYFIQPYVDSIKDLYFQFQSL